VGGFIGSPAMNMVEATFARSNGANSIEFGGVRLAVPNETLDERPDLAGFEGRPVIVGLRPEDMEDAALVGEAQQDRTIRSEVALSEALCADVLVHFFVQAPTVLTEDVKELAHDVGQEALEAVELGALSGRSKFVARLNPRTAAAKGRPIELVVDVGRLHFFDPDSGLGIYGGERN
jgi:multiple sugar transport system ATP-binding protein